MENSKLSAYYSSKLKRNEEINFHPRYARSYTLCVSVTKHARNTRFPHDVFPHTEARFVSSLSYDRAREKSLANSGSQLNNSKTCHHPQRRAIAISLKRHLQYDIPGAT